MLKICDKHFMETNHHAFCIIVLILCVTNLQCASVNILQDERKFEQNCTNPGMNYKFIFSKQNCEEKSVNFYEKVGMINYY